MSTPIVLHLNQVIGFECLPMSLVCSWCCLVNVCWKLWWNFVVLISLLWHLKQNYNLIHETNNYIIGQGAALLPTDRVWSVYSQSLSINIIEQVRIAKLARGAGGAEISTNSCPQPPEHVLWKMYSCTYWAQELEFILGVWESVQSP